MCKDKTYGAFEIKFNHEREFTWFGINYAKCAAKMEAKGTLDQPQPKGPLTYDVRFSMDCGCDTVLGNFRKGFERAYKGETVELPADTNQVIHLERAIKLRGDAYDAHLIYCGIDEKWISPQKSLEAANSFFEDTLAEAIGEEPPYVDADGLVEFIVAKELVDDPVVTAKLLQLKQYLVALCSIVTAYVNKEVEKTGDDKLRYDPQFWQKVVSNLPLMGPGKLEKYTYKRSIRGLEIATDFISFLMDVAVDSSKAVESFRTYLKNQGDAIRFGVDNNDDGYSSIVMSVIAEVMKVGTSLVYLPKLKLYKIQYTRHNSKFTSACASVNIVDIDLQYEYAVGLFDYEALEDPVVKKDFDDFIQNKRKAQIDKSKQFFEDDFETQEKAQAVAA